jgi:hypothetical protein
MREPIEAASALATFLAHETGLVFGDPTWDPGRHAAIVPFESVAGRRHVIAFSETFLAEHSDAEARDALLAAWVPAHLVHPAYRSLFVTNDGVDDL